MAPAPPTVVTVDDLTGLSAMRRLVVERCCGDPALSAASDDVVLLASELVANALVHAGTAAVVRVDIDDRKVVLQVSDGSHDPPRRREGTQAGTGGRGLLIVEALASRWGVAPTGDGKKVWCEVDLTQR